MASQDELLAKFNEIDTDKNGSLSREELDKFCASLPTPPTEAEVNKIYRHMDVDGDGKVTFNEFYEWWTSKENNLLDLLYVKQSMTKKLNKVSGKVETLLKTSAATGVEGGKNYTFSFKSGEAATSTGVHVRVVTHDQAAKDSQVLREALSLNAASPAVVLKIAVNPETQVSAKNVLEDLVEQAKQLAEVMLPEELAEQYLSMVDIKVETLSDDTVALVVSSAHPMVEGILSSYEGLLEQFRVTDQSVVVDLKVGSSLNLQEVVSSQNAAEAVQGAVKGIEVALQVSAAKAVVQNLKNILKMTVIDNPSKGRSAKDKAGFLLAVLNGFSVSISTEDLVEMIPVDKLAELPIDVLVDQVKSKANPKEVIESLPLAQDFITFFQTHGQSTLSVVALVPNILAEVTVNVANVSAAWNKLID